MPDVLSLPIGGGTVIHTDDEDTTTDSVRVGPDSLGYQLELKRWLSVVR